MNWSAYGTAGAALGRLVLLLCAFCSGLLAHSAPSFAAEGPVLVLPKHDETLPGKRIGWGFDDLTGTLTRANTDGKPLVIVFIADPCGWCRIFLAHVLRCDDFNSLAGQAHFMILTEATGVGAKSGDEDQKQLRRLLKVEGYPTTSVISVKDGVITPVAKLSGVVSEVSLIGYLSKTGLKIPLGNRAGTQQSAVGLPRPEACGATQPAEALDPYSPRGLQRGIAR